MGMSILHFALGRDMISHPVGRKSTAFLDAIGLLVNYGADLNEKPLRTLWLSGSPHSSNRLRLVGWPRCTQGLPLSSYEAQGTSTAFPIRRRSFRIWYYKASAGSSAGLAVHKGFCCLRMTTDACTAVVSIVKPPQARPCP
jgi:hypothetical protein